MLPSGFILSLGSISDRNMLELMVCIITLLKLIRVWSTLHLYSEVL